MALGLDPIKLQTGLLTELVDVAGKYIHRVDRSRIPSTSAWTREIAAKLVTEIEANGASGGSG